MQTKAHPSPSGAEGLALALMRFHNKGPIFNIKPCEDAPSAGTSVTYRGEFSDGTSLVFCALEDGIWWEHVSEAFAYEGFLNIAKSAA